LVALDVTVKVAALLWLAVKVCEPERPVPDTARVKVPLLTLFAVVAVVARVARVANVAKVARVAVVAKVAFVAEDAAPLKVAVIVPALKLPEASRATTLLAVFRLVASTANVRAVDPLKVPPLVRYVPAVKAAAVAFAVVAVVANVARVANVAVVAKVALVAEAAEPVVF
jgi:hypothetical protein